MSIIEDPRPTLTACRAHLRAAGFTVAEYGGEVPETDFYVTVQGHDFQPDGRRDRLQARVLLVGTAEIEEANSDAFMAQFAALRAALHEFPGFAQGSVQTEDPPAIRPAYQSEGDYVDRWLALLTAQGL